MTAVGGRFVAHYLHDVTSQLVVFDRSGKLLDDIALPGVGTATGVVGETRRSDRILHFFEPDAPSVRVSRTTYERTEARSTSNNVFRSYIFSIRFHARRCLLRQRLRRTWCQRLCRLYRRGLKTQIIALLPC